MGKRQTRKWTEEEVQVLLDRYEEEGPTELAPVLGRTKMSVYRKANRLGLSTKNNDGLTPAERRQLRLLHEANRQRAYLKNLSPEEKKRRHKERLKRRRERRAKRREMGICIRCKKPSIEHSTSYCLVHWACTITVSCGRQDRAFAEQVLDLLKQQNYRCAMTGEKLIPGVNASLDHIIPRSRDGALDDLDNLQWVTERVNRSKWELTPDEYVELCRTIVNFAENGGGG